MNNSAYNQWADLTLKDLFYAFRKAKADCFYERSLPMAHDFAKYEVEIASTLQQLLERLTAGEIETLLKEGIGKPRVIAKKLWKETKGDKLKDSHAYFSCPDRAFIQLTNSWKLIPEFRLVGDFPISMHILSALWINMVGHKYDAILPKASYGARLRRYRISQCSEDDSIGNYHLESIGSFEAYFKPYSQWRENGIKAIRNELQKDRSIIAITMDFANFYHRIDPTYMVSEPFLNYAGIRLNPWERQFSTAFAGALHAWSEMTSNELYRLGCRDTNILGGIPIGLSISRILSNALLVGIDREIQEQLSPLYYGRYVDDIFVVLRDPELEQISTLDEVIQFLSQRSACFSSAKDDDDSFNIDLPNDYGRSTRLHLQSSKQKLFFLKGRGGLDLLDSIEAQMRAVSSERRFMASPANLQSMASAQVLTAAGQASEEADSLRKADGLSVKRMGWAILLRAVETLSRDLPSSEWEKERKAFYEFACEHILRPDKIFDHLDYLPRLLCLAISSRDWHEASCIIGKTLESISKTEQAMKDDPIRINGYDIYLNDNKTFWEAFRSEIRRIVYDSIIRSMPLNRTEDTYEKLPEGILRIFKMLDMSVSSENLWELSLAVCEVDWAVTSYKEYLRKWASSQRHATKDEDKLYNSYADDAFAALKEFLRETSECQDPPSNRLSEEIANKANKAETGEPSLLPYLFPTRPYTPEEISFLLPERCVFTESGKDTAEAARNWGRYTRALRGIWVHEIAGKGWTNSKADKVRIAALGHKTSGALYLGICSVATSDETWRAAANGTPDLSKERYLRIESVINQAIKARPKPSHVILPELSLPEQWVNTVAGLLRQSGISLIAGLDYHINKADKLVSSESLLVLADDRLGYTSFVRVSQPKVLPAPHEELLLKKNHGVQWKTIFNTEKPVYLHNGFAFGVLVCSELQSVTNRLRFQGGIDCLMVISWNQDIETFSTLIDSSSLDIHCYSALVNNRRFGDSRVRVPAKERHGRDLCRIQGGENENVVIVKVDPLPLRAFQSRAKRWPSTDDPFKPVPEGYEIKSYRETIPQ